jgi:hypothetical protein
MGRWRLQWSHGLVGKGEDVVLGGFLLRSAFNRFVFAVLRTCYGNFGWPLSAMIRPSQIPIRAALFIAFAAVALALVYMEDPNTSRLFPVCPFHAITGLHCPGCGSLRATHALLHGHFGTAFDKNVLAVSALPFLTVYFVLRYVRRSSRSIPSASRLMWNSVFAQGLVVVIIAFWIARNLPWEPFTTLAP